MTTDLATRPLSYSASIPRDHVHRAAICEVFLTDILLDDFPRLLLGCQLPRVHSFYSDHDLKRRFYDPMLLLESFRQTSILIAHRQMGVPLDEKFIFNSGGLRVVDERALLMGSRPANAVIDARISGQKERADQVVGISLEMSMTIDDHQAAEMSMTIQWMPDRAWDRLRARGRTELELVPARPHDLRHRVAAREVARHSAENVVIGGYVCEEDAVRARILVDEGHPGLFDHPLDHIPGALIFEAFRQTGVVAASELLGLSPHQMLLRSCDAVFDSFGELELPTECVARLVPDAVPDKLTLAVEVEQEARRIAHGTISLARIVPER